LKDEAEMEIGITFAGRYYIDRLIRGRGKFYIYGALDKALDRPVELKTIRPRLLDIDFTWTEVLRSEACLAARLCHPNLRRIHGFEVEEGIPFVVMEPVERITLSEFLRQKGRGLHGDEFVRLADQLAAAIEHIHLHDLVLGEMPLDEVRIAPDESLCIAELSGLHENKEKPHRTSAAPAAPSELVRMASKLRHLDSPGSLRPRGAVWGNCAVREHLWSYRDFIFQYSSRPRTLAADLHALGRTLYAMLAGPGIMPDAEALDAAAALALPEPVAGRDWRPVVASCLSGFRNSGSATVADVRRELDGQLARA
jgi:serine/threonine protein kinase